MIQVGIHDNLQVKAVSKNDKNSLVITLMEAGSGSNSVLDSLTSTSTATSENTQDYIVWPIRIDDRATNDQAIADGLLNSLQVLRAQLNEFLLQFLLENQIKWNPLEGLASAGDMASYDIIGALTNPGSREGVIAKIYDNYVNQFIAMMSPHVGPSSKKLRIKLPRTSAEKHFSSFPKFPPFVEDAAIPRTSSKLSWSKWELENKKNDPTPTEGVAQAVAQQESVDVLKMFGS